MAKEISNSNALFCVADTLTSTHDRLLNALRENALLIDGYESARWKVLRKQVSDKQAYLRLTLTKKASNVVHTSILFLDLQNNAEQTEVKVEFRLAKSLDLKVAHGLQLITESLIATALR